MQEKQPPGESIREKTLRRYRSQDSSERSRKKRRVSSGLVVINVAIIALLYFFYTGQKSGDNYQTSSFNYRDAAFRFSMSRIKNSGEYAFYLSARPAAQAPVTIRFTGGMADLVVRCDSDVIVTVPIGREIATLSLGPGESKIQKEMVDPHEFMLYAESHPDRVVEGKRVLLFSSGSNLPLTAEIRIHTEQPVSTSITFKHEVKQ